MGFRERVVTVKRTNTWLAWALVVGLLAFMLGSATASRGKVNEATPVFGYGTGTPLHLDALQAGTTGPRVADVELGFSAANVNSNGFPATGGVNENNVALQPPADGFDPARPFAGKQASARGAGLLLGLGSDLPTNGGDVLAATESGALVSPPPTDSEVNDAGIADTLAPLAYASLLHSEANATWTGNPCTSTISSPISFGRGYAADAQLIDTGTGDENGFEAPLVATDDPNPQRSVVQSRSFLYAIPNGDAGKFGLVSEIHQTYAPVSLARGPLPPVIIEVLGEWVFKATATGKAGGASIEYYTLDEATGQPVTPTTAVIRISSDGGLTYTSLTAQDVFGGTGLTVPIAPLVDLAVGEDPRSPTIPDDVPDPTTQPVEAANGRLAYGAVDVVRLSTLNVDLGIHLEDLRIGHFEAAVGVPDGGFSCTAEATTTTSGPTSTTSSTTTSSTTSSTTSTTLAPTSSTTSSTSSTTSSTAPSTSTTARPTTTAPATTSTTAPAARPATPVNVQPSTVG